MHHTTPRTRSTAIRRITGAVAVALAALLAASGLLVSTATVAGAAPATNPGKTPGTGLVLKAPGGKVTPGQPVQVVLQTKGVARAAAYEAVVTFDPTAVSFGGAVADGVGQVLVVPGDGTVALAALPCESIRCDAVAPTLRLTFTPLVEGRLDISLASTMIVDADGRSFTRGDDTGITLSSGKGTKRRGARAPRWTVNRTPAPLAAPADADVTLDGRVTRIDLAEGTIGWLEGHRNGDPCRLDPTTVQADVNGDACIDISDLELLRRTIGTVIDAEPDGFRGATDSGVADRPVIVVDVTHDGADNNATDGLCATNAGGCSLRAAITEANNRPGPDRITFAIPGTGTQTIQLGSRLPTLLDTTGGTTIDGFTQPGSVPNTDPLVSNAVIRIQVKGLGWSAGGTNFTITSADNVLRGLAIYDAFYGVQALNDLAARNRIVGNHIGTNATGTFSQGTSFTLGAGVWLFDGPTATVIGTPALGDRNVISGNRTVGVKIEQSKARDNIVQNNIVGLKPNGTGALPNNSGFDIQWYAKGNTVGGSAPGAGNLISGNTYSGIDLSHTTSMNRIENNRIGTFADGRTASSVSGNQRGVLIKDNPFGNVIVGNVISGNDYDGLWGKHNYTDSNTIIDNFIGVAADGTPLGNGAWGYWLTGESDIITGNVIAHNGSGGIYVNNSNGDHSNYPAEYTRKNRISNNVFHDNGGLAIDIEPVGPNANDPGDGDAGVHDLLNFPEVTTVTAGEVQGTVCGACTVELYVADNGTDTHGEGRVRVGTATATGGGAFTVNAASLTSGRAHTLLAIDPLGNTSEFSPRVAVAGTTTAVTPTSLAGAFAYQTVDGRQVASVADDGVRNDDGASATPNKVTFDLTVPAAGDYTLRSEVYAPSGSSNSFWAQMDGAPANGFYWNLDTTGGSVETQDVRQDGVATPYVFSGLSAGTHTFTLAMREDGTGVATVSLVPAGGTTNTPATITDPGTQSTLKGTAVDLALAISDADGDPVSVHAARLPSGLVIDHATGRITGTVTTAGTWQSTIQVFDGTAVSTLALTWTVTPGNRAPDITAPGAKVVTEGTPVQLTVAASDPDGDPFSFGASGLPDGLVVDAASGVISGTPTKVAGFPSTVWAADATNPPATMGLWWTVKPRAFTCTVNPDFTLTWTTQGAYTYYVTHLTSGNYVGETTNTTMNVLDLEGTYRVRHYVAGQPRDATCVGPGNPVFACSVSTGGSLTWTDMGASTYYLRHIKAGNDVYVGSTSATSYSVVDLDGTYLVRYYKAGGAKVDTTCAGPGNPVFACSVSTGGLITWTDMNASTYYLRHLKDGGDVYVGSTTATSYQVVDLDGTYLVRYYLNGQPTDTTCEGPGNPVFACSVSTGGSLTWTDMGASTYYIRHIKAGNDVYIGSTTGTQMTVSDLDGTYLVRYWAGGNKVDTTCPGPGTPAA